MFILHLTDFVMGKTYPRFLSCVSFSVRSKAYLHLNFH